MTKNDGKWFAARHLGFGAGLPVAWQGWAAYAVLAAVLTGLGRALLPDNPGYFALAALGVCTLFLAVVARKIRGGLGWHLFD